MAFIGNTVQTQGFTPAIDYFNGNGVTVTFTLSRPVVSVAQMIVAIDNVIQNPSSAFTVSGNSITFTSAPASGTNNIWVEYTSLITTYAAISQSPSVIGDITASGGYLAVGNFGASFIDGTIVDYVTGNGRITTGPADGLTIYNGGTSARNSLLSLNEYGALGVGASPSYGTSGQALVSGGSSTSPSWTTLSVTPTAVSDQNNTSTGYFDLPSGTTAQRPGTPTAGMTRFNTTIGLVEYYNGTEWFAVTPKAQTYTATYLIVAGGGGGGSGTGGGGGAGGYLSSTTTLQLGTVYSFVVGGGGSGGSGSTNGGAGTDSTAFSLTAIGGGGGSSSGNQNQAGTGGSGGGGSYANPGLGTNPGGAGTAGQGNNGGAGRQGSPGGFNAGGGGGASGTGADAGSGASGNGGSGTTFSVTGSTYAGGGGGGADASRGSSNGSGGSGGGGSGASGSGSANTGGGGGGGNNLSSSNGGGGGSGIVIISVPTTNYSGTYTGSPSISTSGANTILQFTSSGSYTG